MLFVKFDTEDMIRKAYDLGAVADQMPYILARTMNDAAEVTRSFLIHTTWPHHTYQRNQSFMAAALTTKDSRAQKGDLTVEIYDKLGRANLFLHAKGGQRQAKSSFIAIGSTRNIAAQRGPHGVVQSMRPRNLKNSFRKGDVVYQRVGKDRLRLMYVLKPRAQINQDVPFFSDFATVMRGAMVANLPHNVAMAMKTRR